MDDTPAASGGMTDRQWLSVVKSEREQSIGFNAQGTVEQARIKAMKAYSGDVGIPSLKGRSSVNDTALADAIGTIMPDLMEVFTGGEDVAAFEPVGREDVEMARQETDAVVAVFMEENDGYNNIHDYCWDALVNKTGLFKVRRDTEEDIEVNHVPVPEGVDGQDFADMLLAEMGGGVTFDPVAGHVEVVTTKERSITRVEVVAPEDFAVAPDTRALRDATYCVERSTVRAQELIRQGHDRQDVYRMSRDEGDDDVSDARDTVEDDDEATGGSALKGLSSVTLYEHYIRIAADDGRLQLWQVLTDGSCSVFLGAEEVDVIPYAAGTPYRRPHRFHGESLADKIMEVQKIKTALWRLFLDSGYFAINQRHEIDENAVTDETLTRWQANRPGDLIPTRGGKAIRAIGGAGLAFDVVGAIEAASVLGEERTGVVRNAQGLNPDTLHDTAKGAQILINAAQKQVRQIARHLAQGIKDAYVLTHRFARANGEELTLRRKEEFISVDPSAWGFRQDAKIKVGVGSGGRETKLSSLMALIERQITAIEMQGGADGPLVTMDNLYSSATEFVKVAGLEEGRYFTDPATVKPKEPAPDPDMVKAERDMELERFKAETRAQLERDIAQERAALERDKANVEAQLGQYKAALEASLAASQPTPTAPQVQGFRPGGSLAA